MKKIVYLSLILISAMLIAFACSPPVEKTERTPDLSPGIIAEPNESSVVAVEYICPDTTLMAGKWSNAKAADKTGPIYGMQLSKKYFAWKNPTSGGALHINANDEIEVYQFTQGTMYMGEGLNENGDTVLIREKVPQDTAILIDVDELMLQVGGIGLEGPTHVLVTSEYELKKSASLQEILNTLCAYSVQVVYLLKK
jgi:hypothetical protein